MVSPWFYTEVAATQGTSVPLDPDHEERAIYLVDGEIEIGRSITKAALLIFRPGDRITVKALKSTRMMFLGGDALEGPGISGGISSPPARSGSSRPNRTGKPAVLPMFPTNMSSFRCGVSYPLSSIPRARWPCLESLFMTPCAPAICLATDRPRQGGDIYAVGDDRVLLLTTDRISAFDVVMAETIPAKAGAHANQRVVVQEARRRGSAPHDQRRRGCDRRASA